MARGRDRGRAQQPHAAHSVRAQVVLRRFALGALLALAGGCAYLAEKQGELIFRPTREAAWWGYTAPQQAYEEQWIAVGHDGAKLNAWWLPSSNPNAPALVYFHGARWNLTGSAARLERWRKLGFSVLGVDYRGFGKSSDAAPSEQSSYEDAEAAWAFLGRLAPGKRHYIVGHSLGGAIAVELARRHPEAAGLVLESTFTSVEDMVDHSPWGFLPVSLILTQRFDAISKIGAVRMPVMIAHGTRDSIVPFDMGEKLYAAAPSPKRFVKVEGAGHHNLSGAGFEDYARAIADLFGVVAVDAVPSRHAEPRS